MKLFDYSIRFLRLLKRKLISLGSGSGAPTPPPSKSEKRKARLFSEAWSHESGIAKRRYSTYEEYVEHQAGKLDIVLPGLVASEPENLDSFIRRFETCQYLTDKHNVLCLGARIGTEVKALIKLGHFSIGIDLNPGPDNKFVCHGDFHSLVFADNSVDAVYSNCLDHVYDLSLLGAEIRRVLKPNGIAVLDVVVGYEQGFYPGAYEALHWKTAEDLAERFSIASGLELIDIRDLKNCGSPEWRQAVLKK